MEEPTVNSPLISRDGDVPNDDVAKYALLDAFHHEPSASGLKDKKRLCLRATRHSVFLKALFIGAACLLLFLVPLFEQGNSFTKSTNYLTRKEESEATKDAFLKSSTALELVLLMVLLLDIVLKGIAFFPFYEKIETKTVPKDRKPNIVKRYTYHHRFFASYRLVFYTYTFCWVVSFTCIIGTFITLDTNWFITTRQLVRPLFLIVQVTMLKKALKAIFNVSWRQLFVFALFALLFIVVFIFMVIGFGIFPRDLDPALSHHKHYTADPDTIGEGNAYFNSSPEAYWNLIVYLSTANSPDIATPAYEHNRFYFLYFGIFYFVGNVLILKVLAVFYAINFNSLIKDSMERTYRHRKSSLHWAFENMKGKNNRVMKSKLRDFITDYNIADGTTFDELWKDLKPESNEIECDNFKKLVFNIFHKAQEKPSKERQRNTEDGGEKSTTEDGGLGQRNTDGSFTQQCKTRRVTSLNCLSFFTNFLSFFVAFFQFFALTVLVIIDYDNTLTNHHSIMAWTMMGFSIVLGIEIITRLVFIIQCVSYCKQCRNRSENGNKKNRCEIIFNWFFCGHSLRGKKQAIKILLMIVDWLLLIAVSGLGLLQALCLMGGNCLDLANLITLIQVTICCIAIRMLRMLAEIPIFSILFKYMIRILFLFIPFLLLGYLFYYEFAIIGMAVFRGLDLNDTEAAERCGSYENLNYHPYNFEDFGSTLVLLWNLMVVNNWHVMVDVYVRRTSIYSRIYFVIWWLVSETIINGVIFGLLIEILTNAKGGLEIAIQKFIKDIKKNKSWEDKVSLFLGFYVFSGGKGRILSEANGYSFRDIIKIVICKKKPKSNISADSPCDESTTSVPQLNLQDNAQPSSQPGGTRPSKETYTYDTYESYNDIDDDSTQESEDEEPSDNLQDPPWNIFDIMEYEKVKRQKNGAKKTKAK